MSRLLLILMAVALAAADETANKTEHQLIRNSRGVLSGDHSRLFGMVDAAVNAATSLTGLVNGGKGSQAASGDTYELVEVPRPSDNRVETVAQVSGQVSGSLAGSYQPCWPAKNENQGPTVTRRVVGQNRRQLGGGPIHHPPVTVSRGPAAAGPACGGASSATSGGSSVTVSRGPSVTHPRGPPMTVQRGSPVTIQSGPPTTVQRGPPVTVQSASPVTYQRGPPVTVQSASPVTYQRGPPATVQRGPPVTVQSASPVTYQRAPPVTVQRGPSVSASNQPSAPSSWKFSPSSLLSLAMPFKDNSPRPPATNPIAPTPTSPQERFHTICMPPCPPQAPCPPPPPPQIEYVHIEHPPQIIEQVVEHHIEHPPQVIETVVEHHIEHPPQIIEQVVEHHIEHPPEVIETVVEHHIEHPPKVIEHTQHVVEKVPQVMIATPNQPNQPRKSKGKFF